MICGAVSGEPLAPIPGPGLTDLLPSRFGLLLDLGLAAVIAVFTDRMVLQGRWTSRVAATAILVVVCASLAPQMPIAAWSGATPQYFLPGGDIARLPAATTALVVPFGAYNELTLGPLLWQAESDFRVRMVSASIYAGGPDGMSIGLPSEIQIEQHEWSLPSSVTSPPTGAASGTTLACVMDALESVLPTTTSGQDEELQPRCSLQTPIQSPPASHPSRCGVF